MENASGLAAWCGSDEAWRASAAAHALLDPGWPAAQALAEVWATNAISPALDVLDEEGLRSVRDVVFRALTVRVEEHWRARWLVRHECLRPAMALWGLDALLRSDADWLAEFAVELVENSPEIAEPVELELAARGQRLDEALASAAAKTNLRTFDLARIRSEHRPEVRRRLLMTAVASLGPADGSDGRLRQQLLEEAAALGELAAADQRAWIALTGARGATDGPFALQLLAFAGDRGHADSNLVLGRLLLEDPNTEDEGWQRIRRAANAGLEDAASLLERAVD